MRKYYRKSICIIHFVIYFLFLKYLAEGEVQLMLIDDKCEGVCTILNRWHEGEWSKQDIEFFKKQLGIAIYQALNPNKAGTLRSQNLRWTVHHYITKSLIKHHFHYKTNDNT